MSRITIEDCLEKISNKFELVRVAAYRAHQIASTGIGASYIQRDNKPSVLALREIAAGCIDPQAITIEINKIINSNRIEDPTVAFNLNLSNEDKNIKHRKKIEIDF